MDWQMVHTRHLFRSKIMSKWRRQMTCWLRQNRRLELISFLCIKSWILSNTNKFSFNWNSIKLEWYKIWRVLNRNLALSFHVSFFSGRNLTIPIRMTPWKLKQYTMNARWRCMFTLIFLLLARPWSSCRGTYLTWSSRETIFACGSEWLLYTYSMVPHP